MRQRFGEIYARNEWFYGSGEGSLPIHTNGYVAFLEGFIRKNRITSILDLGCGDWQFSRFVDWGGAHYRGCDVVRSVIDTNQQRYESNRIEFHLYSGDTAELPGADLLIVKDVLQHLSNARINDILFVLDRYKYALITNTLDPFQETQNNDIRDGDWRYLDIRRPHSILRLRSVRLQ
jgi:SAM-dependent methyltransferase